MEAEMLKRKYLAHVVASALLALPAAVLAQTTTTTPTATTTTTTTTNTSTSTSTAASVETQATVPTERLVQKYTPLAGSEKNAQSLVNGLRSGTKVTLDSTSFTPPTGKMGNGSVNIALSLAEAQLKQAGITDPTPTQLQTALMGGTLSGTSSTTSTKMEGVLQMRADGKGWGQIANTLGFKLGEVMGKADRASTASTERTSKGKPENVGRSERVAERGARPEKIDRPDKVDRPDKIDRPQRPDRPERAGR
jgi:hypothetical protein